MGPAGCRSSKLGGCRGGLLLTTNAQAREAWLNRTWNRYEWEHLRSALALADGFQFFCVQIGDRLADEYLGQLLTQFAEQERVGFGDVEFGNRVSVTDVIERLHATPKPAVFWFHQNDDGASLAGFFLLLNQKREVISKLADAPLVMSMHRDDWTQFRRYAPDFWSIHQMVSRFTAARTSIRTPPLPRSLTVREREPPEFHRAHESGWRTPASDLPAPASRGFFGRDAEIQMMISTLGSPGARMLISGPAGVGKTSLLGQVVPRVARRYSDGIWWVPFDRAARGGDDSRQRAREILERLVLELIPSAAPGGTLEQLSRLFRAATERKDALFIFEDVDDLTVVESLVPGSRASMIVTTRLAAQEVPNVQTLVLGGLGVEAGAALLQSLTIGLDTDAARRVAHAAGGVPSALALAAALSTDETAVETTKRLLADGSKEARTFDAQVERVLANRSPASRSLWAKLGLFHATFGVSDAAFVARSEAQDVASALVELAQIGLIESTSAAGEYRFFPLLRRVAERHLEEQNDTETRLAHAQWALLERGRIEFDRDVDAAVEWLREHYIADETLRERIWPIVVGTIDRWRRIDSADHVMQFALEICELSSRPGCRAGLRRDLRPLADVLEWFGRIALQRGDDRKAEASYLRMLDVANEVDDAALRASAKIGLGDVARTREDPWLALERYRAALGEGGVASASEVASLNINLGDVAAEIGDYEAAELYYRNALAESNAAAYHGLASVAYMQRRYDDSEDFTRKAMAQRTPDDPEVTRDHELMASINLARRDHDEARAWYEKALAVYERMGDLPSIAFVQFQLGEVTAESGDLTTARTWYEKSQALAQRLSRKDLQMEALIGLGELHADQGRFDAALPAFETAAALASEIGEDSALVHIYVELAKVSRERGEFEQALRYLQQSMEVPVEMRPESDLVDDVLTRCYEAAPEQQRPRLRRMWEDAGFEWPSSE